MAVVNHPNPPHNWRDGDGNIDWDAYADEARGGVEVIGIAVKNGTPQGAAVSWQAEDLGNGRSISRGFGGCATCDGGGCGDCNLT